MEKVSMRRWLWLAVAVLLVGVIGISVVRLFSESACPSGVDAPVPVLVAKQLIPKGTPGSLIVKRRLYAQIAIPCSDRNNGALADPASLLGTTTTVDVFPGQQLTEVEISSR